MIKLKLWNGSVDSLSVGQEMEVNDGNRPQGMGGSVLIGRKEYIDQVTHLLELSVDKVTRGGEGKLTCKLVARRKDSENSELPEEGMGVLGWGGLYSHLH